MFTLLCWIEDHPGLAAWLQGLLGILAVSVAIYVPWKQQRNAALATAAERVERRERQRRLLILRLELMRPHLLEALEARGGTMPDMELFEQALGKIRQVQIPMDASDTSELTIPEVEAVIRVVEARNEVLWAATKPQDVSLAKMAAAEVQVVFASRVLDGSHRTAAYPPLDSEDAG